jgi:hypothetical protein
MRPKAAMRRGILAGRRHLGARNPDRLALG